VSDDAQPPVPKPGEEPGEEPGDSGEESGAEAVRTALSRARAAARERGAVPGAAPAAGTGRRRRPRDDGARSGARPDARDPQMLGDTLARLLAERGWQEAVSVGGVMGRWDAVVGTDIAAHCRPETFEAGVLTVRADSSAWATQVRLLTASLLRRLADEVGEGTVTKVVVRGPSGPSWRRGPRVAPGSQGPRDTYG
jgi:predicted nucleic acid-binding Zn ribbon protein